MTLKYGGPACFRIKKLERGHGEYKTISKWSTLDKEFCNVFFITSFTWQLFITCTLTLQSTAFRTFVLLIGCISMRSVKHFDTKVERNQCQELKDNLDSVTVNLSAHLTALWFQYFYPAKLYSTFRFSVFWLHFYFQLCTKGYIVYL